MANLCKGDMIRTVILSTLLVFSYEKSNNEKVENVFALLLDLQVVRSHVLISNETFET